MFAIVLSVLRLLSSIVDFLYNMLAVSIGCQRIIIVTVLLYCHFRVKEIIGYDIEDFIGVDELDFIHPADYPRLLPARQYCK